MINRRSLMALAGSAAALVGLSVPAWAKVEDETRRCLCCGPEWAQGKTDQELLDMAAAAIERMFEFPPLSSVKAVVQDDAIPFGLLPEGAEPSPGPEFYRAVHKMYRHEIKADFLDELAKWLRQMRGEAIASKRLYLFWRMRPEITTYDDVDTKITTREIICRFSMI